MEKLTEEQLLYIYWKENTGEKLSREERRQLRSWQQAHSRNEDWESVMEKYRLYCRLERGVESAVAHLKSEFEARYHYPIKEVEEEVSIVRVNYLRRALVAAIIIGICVLGVALYYQLKPAGDRPQEITLVPLDQVPLPQQSSAVLILANESRISIRPDQQDGLIANEENVTVSMRKGVVTYQTDTLKKAGRKIHHTFLVPEGLQLRVLLPDSSISSLSAATRFRFGVDMKEKRESELLGEGFFKVAPDSMRPFKVIANSVITEALGTHFSIDAYPGEGHQDITLFTGKVRIIQGTKRVTVEEAQIVRLDPNGIVIHSKDKRVIDMVASRGDGKFMYVDESLYTIMKDVGRWYGLKIVNPKVLLDIRGHFNLVSKERSTPVRSILNVLEQTREVKFSLEGKNLTVSRL